MVSLLAVNHEFELWELLCNWQHLFLVYFLVAGEERPTRLLFTVKRVDTEAG